MSGVARWIVAGVVIILVVLLVAWARGADHHRGDEIGTLGITQPVARA